MPKQIIINNIKFKTQKEAINYTRTLNEKYFRLKIKILPENKDFKFYLCLFNRHPRIVSPLENDDLNWGKNINFFEIKQNKNKWKNVGLSSWINYGKNIDSDFSWLSCVKGISNKQKQKQCLNSAMRNVLWKEQTRIPKIEAFRKNGFIECVHCGKKEYKKKDIFDGDSWHVDHYGIEFRNIVNKFLKDRNDIPTKFKPHKKFQGGRLFLNEDKKFEEEWKIFHKKYAKLQILCKKCNLKK